MLVIFDFDGTLTNSAFFEIDPPLFSSIFERCGLTEQGECSPTFNAELLTEHKEAIERMLAVECRGASNQRVVSEITEITGLTLPDDAFEQLVGKRVAVRNAFLKSPAYNVSPNALRALAAFHSMNVDVAIATNSPGFRVMRAMRLADEGQLSEYFYSPVDDPDIDVQYEKQDRQRNIFGAGDADLNAYAVESKPSSFLPLQIAQGAGYSNFLDSVFFVGDAITDIECAKSAGMIAVGYTGSAGVYGGELAQEMIAAGADSVVGDFSNLVGLVQNHPNKLFLDTYAHLSMHI